MDTSVGRTILHALLITHIFVHVRATCDVESYQNCGSQEEYHCQYDASNDFQVEFCATPIECKAGTHAVLDNGTVTCKECSEEMFQPDGKWSNIYKQPNCDHIVTSCSEKEFVCENATTTQNTKCACNETAGYKLHQNHDCNEICFSKDSVCGCELQDLSPPSTPVLTNETKTMTRTDAASTLRIVLSIVIPVIGLGVIAGILVYFFKCRKSKGKAVERKKDEDAGESVPLNRKGNPPGRGIEDETETVDFDDSNERNKGGTQDVTGVRDNAQADKVNTARKVFGGMGHFLVLNCCNTSTSREEKAQETDMDHGKKFTDKKKRDMGIEVTGVKDKATVGTANVAGIVHNGMGNNNRSGGKRDAPLASPEDL